MARAPVLVVEDDSETREALVAALRAAGFPVLASDEGRKALELAAAVGPSVVVLDLSMPGMDGREFLARRKELAAVQRIPVVVVSADRARDVQADAVFQKPLHVPDLLATIARLARR
jgi:DNA-binding response OmpR family regulator